VSGKRIDQIDDLVTHRRQEYEGIANLFGKNLLYGRRQAGLSQQELADLIGMHRVYVWAFERGRRIPYLDTILRLAAGTNLSTCELLAGMGWRPAHYLEFDIPEDRRKPKDPPDGECFIPGHLWAGIGMETTEEMRARIRKRMEDPHHRRIMEAIGDD